MDVREIKFRVWDTLAKRMRYPTPLSFRWSVFSLDLPRELGSKYRLMQFTGLKDKNQREIYEGDIVVNHLHGKGVKKERRVIEFVNGCFDVDREFNSSRDFLELIERGYLEVVGNIFENPELLDKA